MLETAVPTITLTPIPTPTPSPTSPPTSIRVLQPGSTLTTTITASPISAPTPAPPEPTPLSPELARSIFEEFLNAQPDQVDYLKYRIIDVTDDSYPDVILIRKAEEFETYQLLVYIWQASNYVLVYDSNPRAYFVYIRHIGDVNDDGRTELIFVDNGGFHSPSDYNMTINVLAWDETTFKLLHDEPFSLLNAEIQFTDKNKDGVFDIVLAHGGYLGSAGAGPQLRYTMVYQWNGQKYELAQRLTDPCTDWQCTLLSAGNMFHLGQIDEAAQLYRAVLLETSQWLSEDFTRVLDSFIYFRLALIAAIQNNTENLTAALTTAETATPDEFYTNVTTLFIKSYTQSEDVAFACTQVKEFIMANSDDDPLTYSNSVLLDYGHLLGYGWASGFLSEGICPVPQIEYD